MTDNNQHTPEPVDEKRWGGPGSSHQNARQEPPSFEDPREGIADDGAAAMADVHRTGGIGRDIFYVHAFVLADL